MVLLLPPNTPRKRDPSKITPDVIEGESSSYKGTVVKSTVPNNNDMDNDDDKFDVEDDAQKMKGVYEWIIPIPRFVDMKDVNVHEMCVAEEQYREEIKMEPLMFFNLLQKLKNGDDNHSSKVTLTFLEEFMLDKLVSIYQLKIQRMDKLLMLFSLTPVNDVTLHLESVCCSCSSLIELEHTNKAIPFSHCKFQALSKKLSSLYLAMGKSHNDLCKTLVGVNTNIYLYSKGWKWSDNYNDYVKCTVNNLY